MSISTIFAKAQIVVPLTLPDNCNVGTGIEQTQNQLKTSSIKLYPNPSEGTFSLAIESSSVIGIEIYNSSGIKCLEIPAYSNSNKMIRQIDVAYLPNGVYFLKVISENSELNSSFVIQK
jgi:hypothetical protein